MKKQGAQPSGHLKPLPKSSSEDTETPVDLDEETTAVELSAEMESEVDEVVPVKEPLDPKVKRRLILLISLFLLPLLITFYYISPLSKLAKVTVTGNEELAAATVIKSADFTLGDGLWPQYFNKEQVVQKIKKTQPRVEDATVSIKHFNQFSIEVQEYPEAGYLTKGKKYAPILANGVVLEETKRKADDDLPVLEDFTSQKKILATLKAYDELSPEIQSSISQILYTPTDTNKELLKLYMNDGNQVIVNISNLSEQMEYYPQVAKELDGQGVVDMEVGVFSYPYPEETETSGSTEAESAASTMTQESTSVTEQSAASTTTSTNIEGIGAVEPSSASNEVGALENSVVEPSSSSTTVEETPETSNEPLTGNQ
ncbi:MAG: cell division protein FtsQ/DivIB [Enterococcus sp.]